MNSVSKSRLLCLQCVFRMWSFPTVLFYVTIISCLEYFRSLLIGVPATARTSPCSALQQSAWSSWYAQSGHASLLLKPLPQLPTALRLKVKVLRLTCAIGPQITSGFQFYSFSLPFSSKHTYLLTKSLNIFKNLLKCPLITGLPLLLPVHTSPDPLTPLSFSFCFQYAHICLSFMFIAYCLPFSTRIQTQDVYVISSLMYLGNEKSAWSRGGNQ